MLGSFRTPKLTTSRWQAMMSAFMTRALLSHLPDTETVCLYA